MSRWFTAGAVSLTVTGAFHFAMVDLPPLLGAVSSDSGQRQVAELLMARKSRLLLFERDQYQIIAGFSMLMAVLAISVGVLLLIAARQAPDLVRGRTPFVWAAGVVTLLSWWVALTHLPETGLAMLTIALLCFVMALATARRREPAVLPG